MFGVSLPGRVDFFLRVCVWCVWCGVCCGIFHTHPHTHTHLQYSSLSSCGTFVCAQQQKEENTRKKKALNFLRVCVCVCVCVSFFLRVFFLPNDFPLSPSARGTLVCVSKNKKEGSFFSFVFLPLTFNTLLLPALVPQQACVCVNERQTEEEGKCFTHVCSSLMFFLWFSTRVPQSRGTQVCE